jgi:hypothetical protein
VDRSARAAVISFAPITSWKDRMKKSLDNRFVRVSGTDVRIALNYAIELIAVLLSSCNHATLEDLEKFINSMGQDLLGRVLKRRKDLRRHCQ